MMKKLPFPKIQLLLVLSLTLPCLAFSELSTWTLSNEKTFEAEFINIVSTTATFKDKRGKIIKIPLVELSENCRLRVELATPPKLSFDLIKDRRNVNFPQGVNEYTQRPSEQRCHYGIRIKQTSSRAYKHQLHLELFVIGKERGGDKFILLDKQESSFYLTAKNKRQFEMRSEHEAVHQSFQYGGTTIGNSYYGYLAVITDIQGNIVVTGASHDWLPKAVENLRKRYVGNYMDETGERTYPTRPRFTG